MGKKKFIDKKKSAVFQLHARDTSDPNYGDEPGGDRVFVRVDNNPYENPIFEDANEDGDENPISNPNSSVSSLPVSVRKEILELGLPDDGYNYLAHLREIKNTGAGTAYYENSKAKLDEVPHDVKAYDASRVRVKEVGETEPSEESIYKVAAKTVGVKVQRAVDEEIAALLADCDIARFESDDEEDLELEEDFVLKANRPEGEVVEEEEDEIVFDKKINEQPEVIKREYVESSKLLHSAGVFDDAEDDEFDDEPQPNEKPRAPRFLDEQFEMLTLKEYATDSDNDKEDVYEGSGYGDSESEEEVPLAAKLSNPFLDQEIEKLDFDMAYKVPADYVYGNEASNCEKLKDSAADLIRRCAEYGQKLEDESHGINMEELVIWEESSEEEEQFDCESVISTYTNLENHPGKIEAPASTRRKKKLTDAVAAIPTNGAHVITLKGREKLPVGYLPHSKRDVAEKVTKVPGPKSELPKKRPHGEESKEEKKERKLAVKEVQREARKAKKEMKLVYKSETHKAQRLVAVSGPSSIHLM